MNMSLLLESSLNFTEHLHHLAWTQPQLARSNTTQNEANSKNPYSTRTSTNHDPSSNPTIAMDKTINASSSYDTAAFIHFQYFDSRGYLDKINSQNESHYYYQLAFVNYAIFVTIIAI